MRLIGPAITGNYDVVGDASQADCVIGQSFGAQDANPGYVNELLAQQIDQLPVLELPLFLQSEIADSLIALQSVKTITRVIKGKPSTSTGSELDSWEVLRQAGETMRETGLNRPIIMAQAHHVGRVSLQAKKQGMQPIVIPGLPTEFDKDSIQPWTRNAQLWAPREIIGMAYLKVKGKL